LTARVEGIEDFLVALRRELGQLSKPPIPAAVVTQESYDAWARGQSIPDGEEDRD
jgi:hypothetical protein